MLPQTDDSRLVGYARVSTGGQDLDLQLDALQKFGVAKGLIFTDKASGAIRERPGLEACFHELRRGDVLLVWRLDRLGRSVRHLVTLIDQLQEMGVGFRSIVTDQSTQQLRQVNSSFMSFQPLLSLSGD
jgi:DNA invertase Pin-like site-specific DNA recombinase